MNVFGVDTPEKSLVERLGATNVNAALLVLYAALVGFGLDALVLIAIFAQETWPIALATTFVLLAFVIHFTIVVGTWFGGYVAFPALGYFVADFVLLICFLATLVSTVANPSSSIVPVLATFVATGALAVNVYKVSREILENGKRVAMSGVSTGRIAKPSPEAQSALSTPAARKLAAIIDAQQRDQLQRSVRGRRQF
jgi:membrane-associated HD superfamily phosphohydrolase